MILSIFITMLIIGIIFFILAIYWEAWPLNILDIIWFLILTATTLNIEIPYTLQPAINDTTLINGSMYLYSTQEWGLSALLLVFVFINIPLAIYYFSGKTLMEKYRGF